MKGHRSTARRIAGHARVPILALIVLATAAVLAAPAGALPVPVNDPIFTATVAGDGNAYDSYTALALNHDGSLFSCGYVYRDATGDNATITRWDDAPDGWSREWDGPAHRADTATDVVVAPAGPVYVTGVTQNAAGNNDVLLLKYSQAGTLQWWRKWAGPSSSWEAGLKVAVDSSGNILVAGSRRAHASSGIIKMVLVKYAPSGNLIWEREFSRASTNLVLHDFCLDASGNAYLVGQASTASAEWGVIVRYTHSGVHSWTRYYAGSFHGDNSFAAVCRSPLGGVYVVGSAAAESSTTDALVVRYTAAGSRTLTQRLGTGDSKSQWLDDVAVDHSGRIAVCGSWQNVDPDFYVAVLTTAGVPVWSQSYDGGYGMPDEANALIVDASNCVCAAGVSEEDPDVSRTLVYAFSTAGDPRWRSSWPTSATGAASVRDIAAYHSSNVWTCGSSYTGVDRGSDQLLLGWNLLH